jgi:hypothetical protein
MVGEVVTGLRKLNVELWAEETRNSYWRDLETRLSDREMFECAWSRGYNNGRRVGRLAGEKAGELRGRLEGEKAGELRGRLEGERAGHLRGELEGKLEAQLRALAIGFLRTGSLNPWLVKVVVMPFSRDRVQATWNEVRVLMESNESYEGLISALACANLMVQ